MEKRFKIPSKNMGFIATGNDITGFLLSTFIAYYGGRGNNHNNTNLVIKSTKSIEYFEGHRPRWMAFGIITIVVYCLMNSMPHFLYGPGDDALSLTIEYGGVKDDEQTKVVQETNNKKLICQTNGISR